MRITPRLGEKTILQEALKLSIYERGPAETRATVRHRDSRKKWRLLTILISHNNLTIFHKNALNNSNNSKLIVSARPYYGRM